MQHVTALSFLLLVYARYLNVGKRAIHCDDVAVTRARLVRFARSQVTNRISYTENTIRIT